ncbi:MAG: prenyltransferase/squalene oxidase repeat-containing protein [Phycisphaerae bacterium]
MKRSRYLLVGLAAGVVGAAAAQTPTTIPADELERAKRAADVHQLVLERAASQPLRHARARALSITASAARYLLATQGADGGWASETGPGITCLVLRALVQNAIVGPQHRSVRRGVEFVLSFRRDDGGIYAAEGLHKNYETSVALSLLSVLNDPEHRAIRDAATKFLKDNQWDESEQISVDNPWYGGAGYGSGKRPDLSNTQMMLEALHDSGLPKDDPTYQKALAFIQRCQMLGEQNDQPFAKGASDGGFIYSPANGGESKAGKWPVDAAGRPTSQPSGGREELRSYGSMTYAGFKSMLYAGLSHDDPRVRAALEWIRRNWTLDYNPNMPEKQSHEGLYYYYHVFARALAAFGEDEIRDAAGRDHAWRVELSRKLESLQKADGSWVNEEDRWMEGHPALTTAYSMLALQAAFPPAGIAPPHGSTRTTQPTP